MRGGRRLRRRNNSEVSSHNSPEVEESSDHEENGSGEVMSGEANSAAASAAQNTLLEALTSLRTELKDFKQDMRRDLDEFKNDVKKALKNDLAEFKDEVLQELQSQHANIAEAQTRIADLESVCMEMKETLLAVVKENTKMQDKVADLESRSRRNNIRIYGVPEDTEGSSITEFVSELFKRHLALPEGEELHVQRAHRALIPKPAAASSSPRSIIVNFLEFRVKELVLRKAWQRKIEMNGRRLYFDNDYAADVMEKRKAYGPIRAALKEKGIRFQTPYTKLRVHWDSGLKIYGSAEEAARDLNQRGVKVTVRTRASLAVTVEERLNAVMPWQRTNASNGAAQRARERLTEFRRDAD